MVGRGSRHGGKKSCRRRAILGLPRLPFERWVLPRAVALCLWGIFLALPSHLQVEKRVSLDEVQMDTVQHEAVCRKYISASG